MQKHSFGKHLQHTIPLSENYDSQRNAAIDDVLVMLKQRNKCPGNKLYPYWSPQWQCCNSASPSPYCGGIL